MSGTSGAGKSIALHALEDLGFYCIDNLPVALLSAFIDEITTAESQSQPSPYQRAAIGIDARNLNEDFSPFSELLSGLRKQVAITVLFLDANDAVLIKRFSETRRRHPLTDRYGYSLEEAIGHERLRLRQLISKADVNIDTSQLNVHQLRDMVHKELGSSCGKVMNLQFLSFGFKFGAPLEADYIFDVRSLPNPHWEPDLRPLTGRDQPVQKYLEKHAEVGLMLKDISHFLKRWIPSFAKDKRSYLTIAIGCTGGQHRSVYFAEKLAKSFTDGEYPVLVRHREQDQ